MTIKLEDLIYPPVSGFWGKEKQLTSKDILCKVVRNGDVQKNGTIYLDELPERSFLPIEYEKASLLPDDIVLVSSGAYTGNAGRLNHALITDKIIISNFVRRIRAKERVDPEWLFQLIRSDIVQSQVWNYVAGSAMPNLSSDLYKKCNIRYVPETYIQRKIGAILAEIDQAIEKIEALIEKYKKIKAGLMHDLFTRGIGADGKLRPSREQTPELYQETPIGWIPKEWECTKLIEKAKSGVPHLKTGPFGSSLKGEHWVETGHPVITIGALGEGCFTSSELLFISDFDAKRLFDYQMKLGDVVFSRVADVGRSVVIDIEQVGWIMSSNLMRISLDRELVNPNFLQYQLSYDSRVKKQIRCKVNSGGREVANSEILNGLYFVWPSIDEQNEIVKRAEALTFRVNCEGKKLHKLHEQKSGLMSDLLSGKVQVPINSAEVSNV